MRRRFNKSVKRLEDFLIRFYPAGEYTWVVPDGCTEVDVFLVGGGGGGSNTTGGGGGFTKTFKSSNIGWKDGGAISVSPGERISITVGAGGKGFSWQSTEPGTVRSAGYSQFKNSNYRANGGVECYTGWAKWPTPTSGSGGAICMGSNETGYLGGGSDGSSTYMNSSSYGILYFYGQGHTTRDFGESDGKRNAGGGGGGYSHPDNVNPGVSDYSEGSGANGYSATGSYNGIGGGGYGGGGGGCGGWGSTHGGVGGDGTVLIRGKRFKQ